MGKSESFFGEESLWYPTSSEPWPSENILQQNGQPLWSGHAFRAEWQRRSWPRLLRSPVVRQALLRLSLLQDKGEGLSHFLGLELAMFWAKADQGPSAGALLPDVLAQPTVLHHLMGAALRLPHHSFPTWVVDPTLAKMLSLTTVPPSVSYLPEQMPFPAMVLELPPEAGLLLPHPDTGEDVSVEMLILSQHDIGEGANEEAKAWLRGAPGMGGRLTSLTGIAVGKYGGWKEGTERDDCLFWFSINNKPGEQELEKHLPPYALNVIQFVRAFLLLHAARYFRTEEVDPTSGMGRKKQKRSRSQGVQKETRVSLSEGVLRPPGKSGRRKKPGEEDQVASHWVRGHIHSYWVKDLAGAQERRADLQAKLLVVDQEMRGSSLWYKLAYWILPYKKGKEQPEPRETRVSA
tara:strand:- start:497 stop:1714 length:1218 start_codon:yes stop_codon:yes gene_type:complete